jgi:fatty acid desaturase
MNYHTEHHMYAAVPCYNLGKLHKLIKPDLPECPHGLVATWKQITSILERQKQDPAYQYVPKLPVAFACTTSAFRTFEDAKLPIVQLP